MVQIFGKVNYNGTISFLEASSEVELNEFGEIIASQASWSKMYECSVQTTKRNNVFRTQDGIEKISSYQVLVPATLTFDYKNRTKVRLTRQGEFLGSFEVINSELVPTQGRIKIVV